MSARFHTYLRMLCLAHPESSTRAKEKEEERAAKTFRDQPARPCLSRYLVTPIMRWGPFASFRLLMFVTRYPGSIHIEKSCLFCLGSAMVLK